MIGFSIVIGLSMLLHGIPVTGSPTCSATGTSVSAISPVAGTDSYATADDPPHYFDNVPVGDWAYQAAALLQRHKILLGYPIGFFSGKRILTRYEFAIVAKRSVAMIIPIKVPPNTTPGGPTFDTSRVPAEDIKVLRMLNLEFKPEFEDIKVQRMLSVVFIPEFALVGWKTTDDILQKLQDNNLHAEIAAALATFTPKAEDDVDFIVKRFTIPSPNLTRL